MRWLWWWGTAAAVVLVASMATAQPLASGTVFPGSLDNFRQRYPGDTVPALEYDKVTSAVNELEKRSLSSPPTASACANVTLAAGVRNCGVVLTWPSAFANTSYVPVTDVVDSTGPARLIADGIQSKSTTQIAVCVWNRDAGASRTGILCAIAR